MEITLYQINPERDSLKCEFMDYAYAYHYGIDPQSYDRVWSGKLDAENLEDVYRILNGDTFPKGFVGRAMSQSDVCQVVGDDGQSKFYYVDRFDFREIGFDPRKTSEGKEKEITVLACQPGQPAEVIKMPNELKSLQEFVGGYIQAVYPYKDPVALIVNDEGKLENLPLNRALQTDKGEIYDVVAGPMLVVGLSEENFASLSDDMLRKYQEKFKQPEKFVQIGDRIMVLKVPDPKQNEQQGKKPHKHR